jgi:poly(3-hydroxybutyrate) depolymerase
MTPVAAKRVARALTALACLIVRHAEARSLEPPCAGCLLDAPEDLPADAPAPLVVLLHGDEGGPSMIATRFRAPVLSRGFLLLTPKCPRDRGCTTGSYWRWDAEPSWLTTLVDDVGRAHPLDRSRVFLVGWSGGSSYLGRVAPRLHGFSALALVGGGLPPAEAPTCAACALPAYFLQGDRNPLHSLAVEARDALGACGSAIEWDLLAGRDHGGELSALTPAKIGTMLDWMTEHRVDCAAKSAASSMSAQPLASSPVLAPSPSATSVPRDVPSTSPAAPPPRQPATSACGCELGNAVWAPFPSFFASGAALLALSRRRSRPRGHSSKERPREG